MAFFNDARGIERTVIWYEVPPDNPVMPFSTAFGSQTWEMKEQPQPPVGEHYKPRPWRGGQKPWALSVGGLCGTEKQWSGLASVSDPVPELYPGSKVPKCCSPPPVDGQFLLRLGMKTKTKWFPNACSIYNFSNVPPTFRVNFGVNPWGLPNPLMLPNTSPGIWNWQATIGPNTFSVTFACINTGGSFTIEVACGLGFFPLYQPGQELVFFWDPTVPSLRFEYSADPLSNPCGVGGADVATLTW